MSRRRYGLRALLLKYLDLFRRVTWYRLARPVVILHSDDWGLVGIADRRHREELRRAGVAVSDSPWDGYSLETAEDLEELYSVLGRHRDGAGRPPRLGAGFVLANVDFERTLGDELKRLCLRPIHRGWPAPWRRPGLLAAYREGIERGLLYPTLHGVTHFCLATARSVLENGGRRRETLERLYRHGVSHLDSLTPWLGFEFRRSREPGASAWLPLAEQRRIVERGVELFDALFGRLPLSGCAPGYRANRDTYRAWAALGLGVIQEGPGGARRPYRDAGGLLHLHRTAELEPAVRGARDALEQALAQCTAAFEEGAPAVVSIHSINFQSSLRNHRDPTLELLDRLLSEIEERHPDILYLDDGDLQQILGDDAPGPRDGPAWTSRRGFSLLGPRTGG